MRIDGSTGEPRVVGDERFSVNRGALCIKGWTSIDTIGHPDRLTAPLVRRPSGEREAVTWDEALDLIAARMQYLQAQHGRDAVGVYGSGALTNEKAYLLGKFARVALGSRHIDYNGRFCMASGAAASNAAFGLDRGLPFPLADVADAGAILLVGSNTAETLPTAMQYLDAQRRAGGHLIVVDPRRTPTAAAATLHLALVPGTDAALASGLLHVLIRDGLVDTDYIAARTTGFAAVRAAVAAYWPGRVERITGV
ncbi:MAG TPA: molybdopterin-dependent oxidoreductase, partial [Luteitalea sp.]|nr:molybdopterin-dependent oxidoreductase [Luteitalea sp.]